MKKYLLRQGAGCSKTIRSVDARKDRSAFAKSGRGKSSLINAAIVPLLDDTDNPKYSYTPVEIRLSEVKGDVSSP
ncbi:hypothetical protein [Niabella hibiscisoli]|uniref:hypothetical protein n=1 Tax=Niabella hibiscisoli TaxID=1825928 RepID=UPI001F0F575C|nr:hypothetical protein [Niabella hibiscisoli]MCH5720863.1 hypothetical protein [Niabella hibiscisoli]